MARLIGQTEVLPGQIFRAYAGESTEEKPGNDEQTTQRTGNVFVEVDTGDTYFYSENAEGWLLPGASEGGEG